MKVEKNMIVIETKKGLSLHKKVNNKFKLQLLLQNTTRIKKNDQAQ